MAEIVVEARNISKLYQLGSIGVNSFKQDISKFWRTQVLKKKDVYFQEVEEGGKPAENDFWALKNVNFEIRKGEAWGIIGRNGAGKSTFLKILARVIKPTTGTIRGKGKISSLLEVGTGFHPDLTGKENIFISGHMLGMNKAEILKKYDEIVEFSGIEQFLNTPVKRYSSGMYVRLAFSVAAHLEPDILIVDEVLSVGDAEFQQKCLVKMNEATIKSGRTLIFVSHNSQTVNSICNKGLWLEAGQVTAIGDAKTVVSKYLGSVQKKMVNLHSYYSMKEPRGNEFIKVLAADLVPELADPNAPIDIRTPLSVKFRFYNAQPGTKISVDLLLFNLTGECIFDVPSKPTVYAEGIVEGECKIPGNFLNDGSYYFTLYFSKNTSEELYSCEECLRFDVADFRENSNWNEKWWGYVRPNFPVVLGPATGNKTPELEVKTSPDLQAQK